MNAETIVRNVKVMTLGTRKTAADLGDQHYGEHRCGNSTQPFDAGGRRIIAGLKDSHIHISRAAKCSSY